MKIKQEINYVSVDVLKPRPDNPRLIKDEQFKILCQSVKKNPDYFETRPILCDKAMVIFAGTMRWRAAKEVGMKEVPVAVMDIPEERQKELMIRDNRSNGKWDWNILANSFGMDLLKEVGFTDLELDLTERPKIGKVRLSVRIAAEKEDELTTKIRKALEGEDFEIRRRKV